MGRGRQNAQEGEIRRIQKGGIEEQREVKTKTRQKKRQRKRQGKDKGNDKGNDKERTKNRQRKRQFKRHCLIASISFEISHRLHNYRPLQNCSALEVSSCQDSVIFVSSFRHRDFIAATP